MNPPQERGQLHASEELRSVTARFWAAFQAGDVAKMQARLSMTRGVSIFGTDETEYIDDVDALVRYTEVQFEQPEQWAGKIGASFDDPGSPIKVRVGVHTGEVIRQADEFFGQAVNYAARVAGAASGGEILAPSLVHDLVGSDREFRFAPSREVELKGIDGQQRLYSWTA